MRKNLRKLVLSKETLLRLENVVGSKTSPLTNVDHICNTNMPCTGDCASVQTCSGAASCTTGCGTA
jgi:hypothetical protein